MAVSPSIDSVSAPGPWKTSRILGAGIFAIGFLALKTNDTTAIVAYPVAGVIAVMALFAAALSARENGELPYFEVGFFFATIVSIYAIYSMVSAIALDLRFTPLSDSRLWATQPDGKQLARAGWMHVVLLGTFAATYLLVRRKSAPVPRVVPKPDSAAFVTLVVLYILIKLFNLFLVAMFGLRFETYADEYLAYRSLPLVFAQLANHLGGMINSIQLLILYCLFTSYRKNKPIIFLWLGVATALAFLKLGSRTELFLLLLSAMIVYHRLVKPLSGRVVITLGVVALAGFLIMGFLRAIQQGGQAGAGSGSEFDALFSTAVDLANRRDFNAIVDVPKTHYFNDFLALFPQQIVPFKKSDMPTWYVKTFYPEMYFSGGGYAFGMIAEALVGFGWAELVVRAAVLGALLAWFHRWFVRRRPSVWTFALYTWVTAISYQSYRNTTFTPMVYVWFRFMPLFVAVTLTAPVLRVVMGGARRARIAHAPEPAASAI
jgi:oligosaccharide repeat unit polymerase